MSNEIGRIYFGFSFPLLQQYWLYCRKFENRILNLGQFLVLQSRIREKIDLEWKEFKWDQNELDWIFLVFIIKIQ